MPLQKILFFLFLFLSKSIFAQNIDVLKEKIRKNEIFLTDPLDLPFDTAGKWTAKGVKDKELLEKIKQQKANLESFVLGLLADTKIEQTEKMALVHLSAYLGYLKAHDLIWHILIDTCKIYDRKKADYNLIDSYLEEVEYSIQAYYWACLRGLNLRNPAQSMSLVQYQYLEKSLAIFLEKYAHHTFIPNDPSFERLAWHYVLMRKNDPKNASILKIDLKRKKRQNWTLVLDISKNLADAHIGGEKLQNKIQGNFPSILFWKARIKEEIWYRAVMFFPSEAEARKAIPALQKINPKLFLAETPCPPRRSPEDRDLYGCE